MENLKQYEREHVRVEEAQKQSSPAVH